MSVSIINEKCVNCGACIWECPTEAISVTDSCLTVNPEHCTECYGFFGESQCAVVCPVNAVDIEPESRKKLEKKFNNLYPNQASKNTWIWRRFDTKQSSSDIFGDM